MSAEVEKALITKIIEEADMRHVIRQKITQKSFADEDSREVFHYIQHQFQKHGRVPSVMLLSREFPAYELEESDDDLMALIEEIKKESLYRDMTQAVAEIVDMTTDDPEEGFRLLRAKAGELTVLHGGTNDEDLSQTIPSVMTEYEAIKEGKGILGIPWMWPYLNTITQGREAGTFSALYARPKAMKTWLSLADANFTHEQFGTVIGYASCEMPLPQIKRRLACLRAKVPYKAFRSGTLNEAELKRFKLAIEEIQDSPPFFLWQPESVGAAAITELRSKVEEYQLDLLWVDGFYYLMEEESHKAFRVVTRGLKKGIAEPCGIPVCGTTQANRSGETTRGKNTTEVAFGDSLGQDCDWLFRIVKDEQHTENKELLITMPALREAAGGTFTIHAKPAEDFSQKHITTEDEDDIGDDDSEEDDSSII